jgi:hypothetical protein
VGEGVGEGEEFKKLFRASGSRADKGLVKGGLFTSFNIYVFHVKFFGFPFFKSLKKGNPR